jgi:carboxynorspermidine decarboxylase
MKLPTPYYLLDERKLLANMKRIAYIRKKSGAKAVLATKCFSAWCVFDLMADYMDGTTSSSPFEARLGYEEFGKETHAYSVGWSESDVKEVAEFADKLIFNSLSQLGRLKKFAKGQSLGLRVNPGFSKSGFDLADPARKHSRLGVCDIAEVKKALPDISGVMFHFNCENGDAAHFAKSLAKLSKTYGEILNQLDWVSFGGGLYFSKPDYDVDTLCAALKDFSADHGVQVYLEPGESAISGCAELVTTVLDVVHNGADIAVVDASIEAHMLDLLIYRLQAKVSKPAAGPHKYFVAGRSCLAGDVFGEYRFKTKLKVGSEIRFADAAGYTMVKKNWFNGVQMPAIAVRRLDGTTEIVREFGYRDFKDSLS